LTLGCQLGGFPLCEKIRELDKAVQIIFIFYQIQFETLLVIEHEINVLVVKGEGGAAVATAYFQPK